MLLYPLHNGLIELYNREQCALTLPSTDMGSIISGYAKSTRENAHEITKVIFIKYARLRAGKG
jgi:hypothetical protein